MSTEKTQALPPTPVHPALGLRELTEILIKHYDLHEGQYDLLMEFQIGTGMFGPTPETLCPSAMVGISNVGLIKSANDSLSAVDAAKVNPLKKKTRKSKNDI